MEKRANLTIGLALAITLTLGAVQGRRVDRLRESDRFYRWIISAVAQVRLEHPLEPDDLQEPNEKPFMDEELFLAVQTKAQDYLPALASPDRDTENLPRLQQYAIAPESLDVDGETEESETYVPNPAEHRHRLDALWKLARSPEFNEERLAFAQYLGENRLFSIGSQFEFALMYGQEDTMASLSSLFFGFRKMAANLLWLQSDKYWHRGEYHAMLPVMKMTVMLDPTFVDAYLVGAWHLAYNATYDLPDTPLEKRKYDPRLRVRVGPKERFYYQAIDFILDGTRKNPNNYKLYFDLGFAIYYEKLRDLDNAVRYLTEAHRRQHDVWVPRMLYRCMMLNGQYADAQAGYQAYLKAHPENENVPRFIEYCKALLREQKADAADQLAEEASAAAGEARQRAHEAREAGDPARAQQEESQALEHDQTAQTQREIARQFRDDATTIWTKTKQTYNDDTYSEARLILLRCKDLVKEERYTEALADLDYARYQSDELWDHISNLMIDIKLLQGPEKLNVSELGELERRHLREALDNRTFGEKTFDFRDDGWYQNEYYSQETLLLAQGAPELEQLAGAEPHLQDILELARLNDAYPDLRDRIDLGDRVVFKVGDQWYCYVAGTQG